MYGTNTLILQRCRQEVLKYSGGVVLSVVGLFFIAARVD